MFLTIASGIALAAFVVFILLMIRGDQTNKLHDNVTAYAVVIIFVYAIYRAVATLFF